MNKHHDLTGTDQQITLRGPAELADALPYMMGFHPTDSIVLVALHGSSGRFGGRLRLGIPPSPGEWGPVAAQLADCLIQGCRRRGAGPDGVVAFLCREPAEGESGQQVMERLRPLAQRLRTACGSLDVPVYEALCISDGRLWSYCCPDARCCPPDGTPLALPGTSVMAAAAAYAGIRVRGSLRDMEQRYAAPAAPEAQDQVHAFDAAGAAITSRILDVRGRQEVAEETVTLARRLLERMADTPRGDDDSGADAADDRLVSADEAAAVILGLQDRETRDRAAQWMEGAEAAPALRVWRVLSRRCVPPYTEHAAAPLTLAGWVSWSLGDEPGARVALGLALQADPEYVFARLLHQACNEGLDPEAVRHCLRQARDAPPQVPPATSEDARTRARRRRPKLLRASTAKPEGSGSRARRGRPTPGRPGNGTTAARARGRAVRRAAQRGTRSGR
ncbi:DUF4192 domain-containing protein [Streptomyces sp. NPDC048389]|uniref:DUF4192 domain-containing protein n=1 Tax=Streptomyces sp. NPDC048389 TaxID=3154622 RepID=UPI003456C0DE